MIEDMANMPTNQLSKNNVLERQRQWACLRGFEVKPRGYLDTYVQNLHETLSADAMKAFGDGAGSELHPKDGRPAKMSALISSSALALNVFHYWQRPNREPLQLAMGLDSRIESVGFERKFPTVLKGVPPHLDVVLSLADRRSIAIESKFTEWLTRKSSGKTYFRPAYFEGKKLWSDVGLGRCQVLAQEMHNGRSFELLDAPQLLKHALGLSTRIRGQYELWYVYFDCPGREKAVHDREILDFTSAVSGDLAFRAMTYQELVKRLKDRCTEPEHAAYIEYVTGRYQG